MMQVDIQATMPDVKVIVARPLFFDLAELARTIIHKFGRDTFYVNRAGEDLGKHSNEVVYQYVKELFSQHMLGFTKLPMPAFSQLIAVVQQLIYFEWSQIWHGTIMDKTAVVSLGPLAKLDNLKIDRQFGVCPIPLYELKEPDWDVVMSGNDIDAIRELFRGLGIYQYFFPAPDSLALGLVDRGLSEARSVENVVASAPSIGHPFGPSELIGEDVTVPELVDRLTRTGFLVEGEVGVEMTPQGVSARTYVKFRPAESLFTKLLTKLNVNVSISGRDFMGH